MLSRTLPLALDGTLLACFTVRSQVRLHDALKRTPGHALKSTPNCPRQHLPACLTVRSQVCSQDALKHTPENALNDAPNCTRWHTPSLLNCTLPSKLSRRSQAHSRACSQGHYQLHSMTLPAWLSVRSQVSSQDVLKHTPENALKHTPNCTRWHTAGLLDCMIPSKLSRRSQAHSWARSQVHSQLHLMTLPACMTECSQVSSQDTPKNTSEYAPKYTSKSLSSTLPSSLPIALDGTHPAYMALCSQVHSPEGISPDDAPMYAPACLMQRLGELQTPGTGRHEPGSVWREVIGVRWVACGMWHVAGGRQCMLAEIMTSVNVVVWTLSSVPRTWQDLMMP